MDILNRLGINNKVNSRSKFAEFYSLKKDIKSNALVIENSVIANSINNLISYKVSPRGEDGDERKGLLKKTKDGVVNIINKIIAFFKRVKDYIMKKFRQFKEFIFGKKADKVEKATKAATTIINEVIKKDGVVPTNMPNNAWDYIKKQMPDTNKSGQDIADEFVKKSFGPKSTFKVETIDVPKGLILAGSDFFGIGDIQDDVVIVGQYLNMLRYDEVVKNLKSGPLGNLAGNMDEDKFGIEQLEELTQKIAKAYSRLITKFNGFTSSFSKHMEIEAVPISDKEKLKKVLKSIEEINGDIFSIRHMFNDINSRLIKYYDETMKKIEELKKTLNTDANFNELYRDITDMNSILITSNDKLLKEASQLLDSYNELFNRIRIKIK